MKFVVLDEPNSNLDVHGEKALAEAIMELKQQGVTVVVILHRPNILNVLDYIMVMADGKVQRMGRREEMLAVLGRSGASKQPDDVARLEAQLLDWSGTWNPAETPPLELDTQTKDALRELGYGE